MSIKDFVLALNNSIELNENVVKALTDIVLSSKPSTTIENSPVEQTEYFNQKGTSYLYGREPVASDMFDGSAGSDANEFPYPVIESFGLGETPNILEDKLGEKITTLSSINDTTRLVLGTLAGVLSEYDSVVARNELSVKSKTWKTFSIGSYWPVGYGLSANADHNSTQKEETTLVYNQNSKYAFIKLSPNKDVKFHYITIDVDVIADYGIPAIFIILDSFEARDGDQFEFRVEYITSNEYSDQSKWPEVMFFDSSYNSNGVPLPSISSTYDDNEEQVNNAIQISGVDYFYVQGSTLPAATKALYSVADTERVFISAPELNNRITNHAGKYDKLNFVNLKQSKYIGYGILGDKTLKTYKNTEINITGEVADSIDNEVAIQKFARKRTVVSTKRSIEFSGVVGSSVFYGRPSSFFSPKSASSYSYVPSYADAVEGIDGNVVSQYMLESFEGYLIEPDANGIVISYELNQDDLNGNVVAIRMGHFESLLGFTLQYEGDNLIISHQGSTGGVARAITLSSNVKCSVGFISINSILHARYIVKSNDVVIYDSKLMLVSEGSYLNSLLASKILTSPALNTTASQYLTEDSVYRYWKPTISVMVDGRSATGDTRVKLSNVLVRHGLFKEEFNARCDEFASTVPFVDTTPLYWNYSSVRGPFTPIIKRPSEIKGFIVKVDASSANTYSVAKEQSTLLTSYRVGFTYNAYKGAVLSDRYMQYTPIVSEKDSISATKESTLIEYLPEVSTEASSTELVAPTVSTIENESISMVPSLGEIAYTPSIAEISETEQVDSIYGHFGWKVTTYYQSIG